MSRSFSAVGDAHVVLDVYGEGRTDVHTNTAVPVPPDQGVVPILVHALCGRPDTMRVKRRCWPELQGKGLGRKLRYVLRQAGYGGTDGVVFVVDADDRPTKLAVLIRERDAAQRCVPAAVGAAKPCLEAWLLADPAAIRQALGLVEIPSVSDNPENLPSGRQDANHPKRLLARLGAKSAADKDAIARAISDVNVVAERCPASFAPFAKEIRDRIAVLFAQG
jgi:hypothetical protein